MNRKLCWFENLTRGDATRGDDNDDYYAFDVTTERETEPR